MSTTILQALEKRQSFFVGKKHKTNLNNAVSLLIKGYCMEDDIDALLGKFGSISNVPAQAK